MYLLSLSVFSSSFAAQFSEKVRNMSPDEIRIPPEPPGRCSSHLQVRWSLYSVWDVLDLLPWIPVREILRTLVHCACFLIDASLSYQISCSADHSRAYAYCTNKWQEWAKINSNLIGWLLCNFQESQLYPQSCVKDCCSLHVCEVIFKLLKIMFFVSIW